MADRILAVPLPRRAPEAPQVREVGFGGRFTEPPKPDPLAVDPATTRTFNDQARWEINAARQDAGLRPVSPPKNFRKGYPKLSGIRFAQNHASSAHTLPHNAKRIPKRKAPKP
jgi:hypothetical protein